MTRPGGVARWRVMLADDHVLVREGLAMLIGAQADMEVVAQARGGREAVQLADKVHPDIVVLDISLPDVSGTIVAEQMSALSPSPRILALTRHADQGYLRRMFRAGAQGYVVKRSAADALINAIRTVAEGGIYVDPSLAGELLARSLSQGGGTETATPPSALSEREKLTLKLIAWGKSNKEVALQLGISVKTAESYKASALVKLNLRTRTDILRHALAEGWLSEEGPPE